MSNSLDGDWKKLNNWLQMASKNVKPTMDKATGQMGSLLAKRMRKGVRKGAPGGKAFTPLSALTIANKKDSTSPLIDHNGLIASIGIKRAGAGEVFVGVRKGQKVVNKRAPNPKEVEASKVAWVHENGMTIKVTWKMRKVFRGIAKINLKKETMYIRIPARPFIAPTLSDPKNRQAAFEKFMKVMKEGLQL